MISKGYGGKKKHLSHWENTTTEANSVFTEFYPAI